MFVAATLPGPTSAESHAHRLLGRLKIAWIVTNKAGVPIGADQDPTF
jgi:hypothetical protein